MQNHSTPARQQNYLRWPFLTAFSLACFVFWWLSALLYRVLLDSEQGLDADVMIFSFLGLALFVLGYSLPWRERLWRPTRERTLDRVERLSYKATIVLALPALLAATAFTISRWGMEYQEGSGIPLYYQAILYVHLFVGLLYIGTAQDDRGDRRKIAVAAVLTILPRVIVSLHWGRFFAAQAILPVVFIALARGWMAVSVKRMVQFALLAVFIIFIPSLTRGDKVIGEDDSGRPLILTFFEAGNTLLFFQDNRDMSVTCPPLLVSATSKVIPYHLLHLCTVDVGDDKALPATLDNLLTHAYTDDLRTGTGGNYLLELYCLGGAKAIVIGTLLFGFTCRRFVSWIGHRSLYAGIWAECLSRALLAPRGNLGYMVERIPSLVLATGAFVALAWSIDVLARRRPSSQLPHVAPAN